ncbi:hypothetical protein [Streptomyces sp. NL15-2K]|uniref:hypothetical protein n=1 Tax=Streptomyces sp. NL15-2K TaxID=376149 RepID=UPI000F57E0AC|nr:MULTISPECIES: hypothetical protein [Actinomycetes]WKX09231.1 hypothetical protein Q4V64_17725 [Kutzneria buriramensis]GCB49286.1 hypothetical protein SNL152K_6620 [Streptomyces sp. NL15-2K]
MHKYQKVAVVAAMLGSVSFLGAGVGHADGDPKVKLDNKQSQECSADEVNIKGSDLADVFAPTNAAGFQFIDQSKRTSVECAQLFTIGR